MDVSDDDIDNARVAARPVGCHHQANICDFRFWSVDVGYGEQTINIMVAIPDSNQEIQVLFKLMDACRVLFSTNLQRALLKKWKEREADIKAEQVKFLFDKLPIKALDYVVH